MGLSWTLIGLPLFVMIISIIFQTGAATASATGPVDFSNPNPTCVTGNVCQTQTAKICTTTEIDVSVHGKAPCYTTDQTTGSAVCMSSGDRCALWTDCNNHPVNPSYCALGITHQNNLWTVLDNGQIVRFAQTSALGTGAFALFSFGSITIFGFIVIITVAVAVAVVLGVQVLGSGVSPESIHILFLSATLLGMWGILTAAEGFLTHSSTSFFVSLDGAFGGLGDIVYILLSLGYVIGVIGAISRGGVGS